MYDNTNSSYIPDDAGKLEYKRRETYMFNVDVMDSEGNIIRTELRKGFSSARILGISILKADKDETHFVRVCCYKHPELIDFITHHRIRKYKGKVENHV